MNGSRLLASLACAKFHRIFMKNRDIVREGKDKESGIVVLDKTAYDTLK